MLNCYIKNHWPNARHTCCFIHLHCVFKVNPNATKKSYISTNFERSTEKKFVSSAHDGNVKRVKWLGATLRNICLLFGINEGEKETWI